MKSAIWNICLLLVFSLKLSAQVPYFKTHEIFSPNSTIQIEYTYQSEDGFLWFGTNQGVFRYDGISTERIEGTASFLTESVSSIIEIDQILYIGTEKGTLYQIKDFKLTDSFHLPQPSTITQIQKYREKIVMGTSGEGLFELVDESLHQSNLNMDLIDLYINDLELDSSERLWIATDHGVHIVDTLDQKQLIDADQGLGDNIVTQLNRNGDQMLIGTQRAGLYKSNMALHVEALYNPNDQWRFGSIRDIVSIDQRIWASTEGYGIIELADVDEPYFRHYTDSTQLLNEQTSYLMLDREGSIWVTFNGPDIQSFNFQFEFIENHEGYDWNNLTALKTDTLGHLWFANEQGLYKHDLSFTGFHTVRQYLSDIDFSMNRFISIYPDEFGRIWIGSYGNGLFLLNPESGDYTRITMNDGFVNDNILSISGRGRQIWFATLGGCAQLRLDEDGSFEIDEDHYAQYNNKSHGISDFIYDIQLSQEGTVWMATDGKGIISFKNDQFKLFSKDMNLDAEVFYSVDEDEEGGIWFASANNGLVYTNGIKVEQFDESNGLPSNLIHAICANQNGQVIVSTQSGLEFIDIHDFSISHYGAESGIGNLETELNVMTSDSNGSVWVDGKDHLLKIQSQPAYFDQTFPLILKSVQLFLQPLDVLKSKFKSGENHISFDYRGLWYSNPEAISYRYKLEGHDIDWNVTTDDFKTYSNLSPGDYNFVLETTNHARFKMQNTLSYPFKIRPPFYQKPWFIILVILLFAGLAYWFTKTREQRIKQQAELKKEQIHFQFETLKSQINPHFMFNSFNTLIGLIEENQYDASDYVEKLSDLFRNVLEFRDKDVVTLKEELKLLDDYIYLQKKRFGEKLHFDIEIDIADLNRCIPPLTLQLLVENAIKHNVISKNKPLFVELFSNNECIIVKNNVQPKQYAEPSTGFGLESINSRYSLLSSKPVSINQTEKEFIVQLPLL